MMYNGAPEYYFYKGLDIGNTFNMHKPDDFHFTLLRLIYLPDLCPVTSVSMRDKCIQAFTDGYLFGKTMTKTEYISLISEPERATEAKRQKFKETKPKTDIKNVTWN